MLLLVLCALTVASTTAARIWAPSLTFIVAPIVPVAFMLLFHRKFIFPFWYHPEDAHGDPKQGFKRPVTGRAVHWYGKQTNDPKTDFGLDFEHLVIPGNEKGESFQLSAWHIPSRGPSARKICVVCVHGAGRDRRAFMRHFPVFHRAGYGVLAFDSREHGFSTKKGRGCGYCVREAFDVGVASKYAREALKYDETVLLGTSQGGAAVIVAAVQHDEGAAVISENPMAGFYDLAYDVLAQNLGGVNIPIIGLLARAYFWLCIHTARLRIGLNSFDHPDAADCVHRLHPRPLLIMHGTKDAVIPVRHGQKVFANAKQPTKLWLLQDGEHTGLFNLSPKEWSETVLNFLQEHHL